jgi:hypothetical protein
MKKQKNEDLNKIVFDKVKNTQLNFASGLVKQHVICVAWVVYSLILSVKNVIFNAW